MIPTGDGLYAPGDAGPECLADYCSRFDAPRLLFDAGEPQTLNEPEQPESLFCPRCGCEWPIDWRRMKGNQCTSHDQTNGAEKQTSSPDGDNSVA